eukprot:gene4325-4746_t
MIENDYSMDYFLHSADAFMTTSKPMARGLSMKIVIFCGFVEWLFAQVTKDNKDYVPGDYYGITNRIQDKNDPWWISMQTRELNNGRLAMFAIVGEIAHAALTGKGALEQIGF